MFSRIRMALRAAFDAPRVESEMDKEMRLHLDMETEANIRRGMSPTEARRVARVAFGGVENAKEGTRDERATRWMQDFASDLRMGLRGMRKSPAFTVTVIVLLALGTGANTAIFSVVNQLMLNPLPFPDGERMVKLQVTANKKQIELPAERAYAGRWRARNGVVEDMLVSQFISGAIGDTSRIPAPPELEGHALLPGAMRFVGMQPFLGREVIPADTIAGATPVVILSERLWKREFAGARSVIGTRILFDGRSHVVIGVAPGGFTVPFSQSRDIFTALPPAARGVDVVAKLKRGVTMADVNRELATLGPTMENDFGVPLDPAKVIEASDNLPTSSRQLVLALFGAVGFVLLIACANVANLMLSRAWSRQREFAVRRALGAGRARLLRQVLTEGMLFALAGGAGGILVSVAFLKVLIASQPPNALIPTEIRLDRTVFLWTLGISLVTGLLFAIAPAMFASGRGIEEALKSGARSVSGGAGARRLRGSLVVLEVAISVVLLAGTGLLTRTLAAMQRADLGIAPQGLAALDLRLQGDVFQDSTVRRDALKNVLNRVRLLPGVSAAAYVMVPPPRFGMALTMIEIEGRVPGPGDSLTSSSFNMADPGMFEVAGIRIVAGHAFAPDPGLSDASRATEVMINQRAANRFWPDGRAVGARIRYQERWMTIVGIVNDVTVPGNRDRGSALQFYLPMPGGTNRAALLVRSPIPAALLETQLRRAVKEVNGQIRFRSFTDVEASLYAGRATHRFILALLGVFATLALVLAAIGLHAVISYSVTQRRRELGIRVALGAQLPRIASLVIRQGVLLSVIGIAIGIAGAAGATRALSSLLYGTEPGDPLTSGVVGLILLVVSIAACALPARRAIKIDPVEMLRAE